MVVCAAVPPQLARHRALAGAEIVQKSDVFSFALSDGPIAAPKKPALGAVLTTELEPMMPAQPVAPDESAAAPSTEDPSHPRRKKLEDWGHHAESSSECSAHKWGSDTAVVIGADGLPRLEPKPRISFDLRDALRLKNEKSDKNATASLYGSVETTSAVAVDVDDESSTLLQMTAGGEEAEENSETLRLVSNIAGGLLLAAGTTVLLFHGASSFM